MEVGLHAFKIAFRMLCFLFSLRLVQDKLINQRISISDRYYQVVTLFQKMICCLAFLWTQDQATSPFDLKLTLLSARNVAWGRCPRKSIVTSYQMLNYDCKLSYLSRWRVGALKSPIRIKFVARVTSWSFSITMLPRLIDPLGWRYTTMLSNWLFLGPCILKTNTWTCYSLMAKGGFYEGGFSPMDHYSALSTKKRIPSQSKFASVLFTGEPGRR